jgi:hypothetical protein
VSFVIADQPCRLTNRRMPARTQERAERLQLPSKVRLLGFVRVGGRALREDLAPGVLLDHGVPPCHLLVAAMVTRAAWRSAAIDKRVPSPQCTMYTVQVIVGVASSRREHCTLGAAASGPESWNWNQTGPRVTLDGMTGRIVRRKEPSHGRVEEETPQAGAPLRPPTWQAD